MANNQEVELKLYVPDLDAVRARLEALNAPLKSARVFERNVRYDDASNRLSRRGLVLRLRHDTRTRLTYKEENTAFDPGGIQSRFEAEVEVSDFDTMDTMLRLLGFQPYMVYEKYRTTYKLEGCEVTLDEMPYGNFVEIEGEEDAIRTVRQRLELDNARSFQGGYSTLFERVRRALGLDFDDLTFANFDGIDIPESAFKG